MQQYADIYLLLNYSTCFGRPSRPSSGVHKTIVAASGTDLTVKDEMGTGSFPGVKCGRGVLLTTHHASSAAVMEE